MATVKWNNKTYDPGGGNHLTYGVKVKFSGPLFQPGNVEKAIKSATRKTLEYGKGIIQDRTPVKTGLLQSSWHYRTAAKTIYNEVPYSIFVEYGTSRMDPRHMARNSLGEIQNYYAEAIAAELKRTLE